MSNACRMVVQGPLLLSAAGNAPRVWRGAVAALFLGHWPIPSVNDPKQIATAPLHLVAQIAVLGAPASAVTLLAVCVKSWRVLRAQSAYWWWLCLFLVSIATWSLDYRDTWTWWWD
jgi:hypothetical protein